MDNWKTVVKEIAYRIAFILMGAQIVLGALWFCANLATGQNFPETAEFLEISETWVLDEYVGIAYPGVLWLFRKVFGDGYEIWLYLTQFASVYGAAYFLLERSGILQNCEKGKWKIGVGAAYISTVPVIMQFQLAQLPYSFAMAAFLVVLGECFFLCASQGVSGKELRKKLLPIAAGWMVGALFLPEYGWVMAIPVAVALGMYMWRSKKCYPLLIMGFVLVLLVNVAVQNIYQEPGSRGRMEKSVSATLLRRVVWPNFVRDSFFWSHPVKILFSSEDLQDLALEPENVVYTFGPLMEQTYGKETAEYEYMLMVRATWDVRTKEVVGEIARDALGYACPQLSVLVQLQGEGTSRTGFGYHCLSEKTPILANYYVNISLIGFGVLLVMGLLLRILQMGEKSDKAGKNRMILSVITIVGLSAWYTMEAAGVWDYRNVTVISALWAMCVIRLLKNVH